MMEAWLEKRKIWLYQETVDFRKQAPGLVELTAAVLEKDPSDGSVYIFRNRSKDKVKLLVWERNGYFLGSKTLEKGRFAFPMNESGQREVSVSELMMLISGMPMVWRSRQREVAHY